MSLNWLTLYWVMLCLLMHLPIGESQPPTTPDPNSTPAPAPVASCDPPAVKIGIGCVFKLGYDKINKHTYYFVKLETKSKSKSEALDSCDKAKTELDATKFNHTKFHAVKEDSFECGRDVLEGLEEYTGGIQTEAILTGADNKPAYNSPCKFDPNGTEEPNDKMDPGKILDRKCKTDGVLFQAGSDPFVCLDAAKGSKFNVLCEGYA